MRDVLIVAGLVGLVIVARQWHAARAVPAPAGESSPKAAEAFLSGTGTPDSVLGADRGYGPLRSAWG